MTDIANRIPEQTGLSRTLANTETLQIAELHLLDVFCTPIEDRRITGSVGGSNRPPLPVYDLPFFSIDLDRVLDAGQTDQDSGQAPSKVRQQGCLAHACRIAATDTNRCARLEGIY